MSPLYQNDPRKIVWAESTRADQCHSLVSDGQSIMVSGLPDVRSGAACVMAMSVSLTVFLQFY